MKKGIFGIWLLLLVLTSCEDDDINLFEKTADERVAEAIAELKEDLVAPDNGWRVLYRPESGSGSFYVLMDFNEDNSVTLKTDLGSNDGEFFEQTVTYRIDSSLGLELIMESYCFFSFLFEQDQASFGAEYEFLFVNKTPDDELVFTSKTDFSNPTVLLFEESDASDETELLGVELSTGLNELGEDLNTFTSSFRLTYDNKDIAFYVGLDDFRRVIDFKSASRKNNTQNTDVNFTTPYVIKGDSIVFDTPLVRTILGNNISIKSIKFNTLTNSTLNICPTPIDAHSYAGVTSANDPVKLESSLVDINGKNFATLTDFYVAPLNNIVDNGQGAAEAVAQDITGALAMQLYYNYDNDGFYAMGFIIQNSDGTVTFALREFTSVLSDNRILITFAPDISIFGNPNTDANVNNIDIYLNALAQGGDTYVLEYSENIYEFHNPCTGWSFGFQPILQ